MVDGQTMLIPYYPYYKTTLNWYQDPSLCKQVDNRDEVYDLDRLKRMYRYLDRHGDLFYIKYKRRLCGDVCLQDDGQINIVIIQPFQNKHIGRHVVQTIIKLAYEKQMDHVYADIYRFNIQSRRMFEAVGFTKVSDQCTDISDRYEFDISRTNNRID